MLEGLIDSTLFDGLVCSVKFVSAENVVLVELHSKGKNIALVFEDEVVS